jgi:putative mRNA 3-end processing factor
MISSGGHGIFLKDFGLSLDNSHPEADVVFVSHAHADHLPRNRSCAAVCSAPTLAFMQKRGYKGDAFVLDWQTPTSLQSIREYFGIPHGGQSTAKALEKGPEKPSTREATLTLYPAGHILGSAMILIESDDGALLYTGDVKSPASPATEGVVWPSNVDELIIEATFGLPIYKWRPTHEIQQDMLAFAKDTLEAGETPLFLGYNLGKAQEILHLLEPMDHRKMIHGGGYPYCEVYQQAGISLGNVEPYDRAHCEGAILVGPTSVLASGFASNVERLRVAQCSGWAALASRRTQLNLDRGFALSDHLDFFELLDVCDALQPRTIHITHSPTPDVVAHFLEQRGHHAQFLNLTMEQEEELDG